MTKIDHTEETINSYNKVAQNYTDTFFADDSDKPYIDAFIKMLPESASILDAGCGPGNYSQYLHGLGFKVTGTDLSEGMLNIARSHIPSVTFIQADLRELPFEAGSFDGIVAAYSIIHLPTDDVVPTLKQFNTLLRQEGMLFLALQEGTGKSVRDESLGENTPLFYSRYTEDEISELLLQADFKVLQSFVREPHTNEIPNNKLFIIAQK